MQIINLYPKKIEEHLNTRMSACSEVSVCVCVCVYIYNPSLIWISKIQTKLEPSRSCIIQELIAINPYQSCKGYYYLSHSKNLVFPTYELMMLKSLVRMVVQRESRPRI